MIRFKYLITGKKNNRAEGLLLIICSVFFILACFNSVQAQNGLRAYDHGLLFETFGYIKDGSADSSEVDFIRAAMTVDADSAVEIYRQIVLRNPESEAAKRAMDRIRQYNYAQGLYKRADELGSTLGEWQPPQRRLRSAESTPPPPISFNYKALTQREEPKSDTAAENIIEKTVEPESVQTTPDESPTYAFSLQVGAFSSRSNANNLKKRLEDADYQSIIVPPEDNPTSLYMVRVIGFQTVGDAFSAAELIQQEFSIQPIVVPSGGE